MNPDPRPLEATSEPLAPGLPTGSGTLELTRDNPWPGLQSFDEPGCDFFHGRRDETEEMLRLVRRERLVVFYGQSGLGKTSLLRAGLFPLLRPLRLLPVSLRVDYSEAAPTPVEQLKQELLKTLAAHAIQAPPPGADESLWAYFHRVEVIFRDSIGRPVVPVLVFDQFEERFTLGRRTAAADARAEAFLTELSQLVENRPPLDLRARLDADPEATLAYDFDKQACRVLLSLREDFLPELESLTDRFPSLPRSRFRLLPMTRTQASEVILGSGRHLVSETVANAIVDFVSAAREHRIADEVEPALLSLVLRELNTRRSQRGEAQISADLLSGSKAKILEDFFEHAVSGLPAQARLFLEDGLLTSSGYRDSIALEDARAEFGLDDTSLTVLINRHLVRREERLGATRLELVHDLLTGVIASSRDRRRENDRRNRELETIRARQLELEREQETQRRRSRRLMAVCVGLVLVFLGVGAVAAYWAYLVHWPYVSYSRDFTKRWGVAWPVGPLTEEMTRHRALSLKFIRRGRNGPLLEMQAINARGQLTDKHGVGTYLRNAEENENPVRECRWEFVYDSAGNVVYEKAFDLQTNLVWGMVHSPTAKGSRSHIAQYVGPDGLPQPQRHSSAEFVRIEYSEAGFEELHFFQDRYGRPQPGLDRAFGRRRSYDSMGRLLRDTSLGPDGKPMRDETGNATLTADYDASGYLTNSTAMDEHDRLCLVRSGYCRTTHVFDRNGNQVERALFDVTGNPTLDREGVHRSHMAYDEWGNWTNWVYLGTNDLPILTKNGYASITAKWDARGNQIEWACFDKEGKPTIETSDGFHMYRQNYDERGHWTNWLHLGTNGQPILTKNGYASITAKWDARGNQIEWACFDKEGKPTIETSDGFHMYRQNYDERGHWTNWLHLGTNRQPILTKKGYASITAKWDARGNQIEWACFDKEGKPTIETSDGFHICRQDYDERGHWTNWLHLGTNGQPTLTKKGYASITAKWDERGNQIEWACFDKEGKPTTDPSDGSRMSRWSYDERGNWTNRVYLGRHGQPILTKKGYASITAKWDARGNQIEWACFDKEGKPTIDTSDGSRMSRWSYDERGHWTNRLHLGTNGQPILTKNGYASIAAKWDERGNQIEWACFDKEGKPTIDTSDGSRMSRWSYDERGNWTNRVYLGANGQPILTKNGYASITAKWDERGNQIEWACYGISLEPVLDIAEMSHMTRRTFDERGHTTAWTYLGTNGLPTRSSYGFAAGISKYDDRGNRLEWACFDEAGRPALNPPEGYHMSCQFYDERGNWTNWVFLNTNGQPILTRNGYASITAKWDERGNQIEWACFGTKSQPILNPNTGVHMWRMTFDAGTNWTLLTTHDCQGRLTYSKKGFPKVTRKSDPRGLEIERAFFDREGKPTSAASDDPHMVRTSYDERGHWTNRVYLGTNGQPILTKNGYASMMAKWDERGNQIEWACFGEAAQPITGPDGYHRRLLQYGADGRILSERWFDTAAKEMAVGVALQTVVSIGEVFPDMQGAALGILKGDVVWTYDTWHLLDHLADLDPGVVREDLVRRSLLPGGQRRRLVVLRNGQLKTFEVAPGRLGVRFVGTRQTLPRELLRKGPEPAKN